jgi:predicted transposase/invertase (TIGR01784 family)
METDSFFYQLFKQLPQTLFELLGLPSELAKAYRFDSVELKKSFRIDGLFLPNDRVQPFYVVEVQFRKSPKFYANLFAKVFTYLGENDPGQEWAAVALFGNRRLEPTQLGPYDALLRSRHVTRIYLDELSMPADPPLGLGILQMVSAHTSELPELVSRLVKKAEHEIADSVLSASVIELTGELLLRRFTELDREEVRQMFQLQDIRKSKVWQEARESGREEGRILERMETIRKCLAKGMSAKEIAEFMEISLAEARKLAKAAAK